MPYASRDDLLNRVGADIRNGLASDAGGGEEARDAILDGILKSGSDKIDGYLMSRYLTPISGPPAVVAVLRAYCLDMASFMLFERKGQGTKDEAGERLYKAAEDYFKMVAKGDVDLSGSPIISVASMASESGTVGSDEPVFRIDGSWGAF